MRKLKNLKLKDNRIKRNMTQKDMAILLGNKTVASYNMKENGKRNFSLDDIKKISNNWDLSAKDIKEIFF